MNKRFDWMTPEEAARELEPEAIIWVMEDGEVEPAIVHHATPGVCWVCGTGCEFNFKRYERICRAMVPEVPSE